MRKAHQSQAVIDDLWKVNNQSMRAELMISAHHRVEHALDLH